MNPGERFPPDNPAEWLNRARSNLAIAKNRIPDAYLEDLCFEAQQAVEKAIKAILIAHGIDFPYVHDLARLLSLLEENGECLPDTVRQSTALTPYAVLTRYPAPIRPVTLEEYNLTVEIAETVVRWAESRLQL